MRRLDQWVVREYHLPLVVTIENAGRCVADLITRRFAPKRTDPIVALVGRGFNGAVALAAARTLLQVGYAVSAATTDVHTKFRDETLRELQMFRKFGGHAPPFLAQRALPEAAFLLDGLIGYGLTDSVKGTAGEMIRAANDHEADVVAVDIPSGLQPDQGTPDDPTTVADATVALALPKQGVTKASARKYVGELYLGDVGLPRPLYDEFGVKPEDLFSGDLVVRLA